MTYDGTFTKKYKLRGQFPSPGALIVGPDGALWINQGNHGRVTRLDVGLDLPVTAKSTTFTAKAGRAATHTVATFTDANPNARARDYDVTISWGDGTAPTVACVAPPTARSRSVAGTPMPRPGPTGCWCSSPTASARASTPA
jgi:hypothetical protein